MHLLTLLLAATITTSSADLPALPKTLVLPGTFDCAGTFGSGKIHRAVFTASAVLKNTWLELTEQDVEPATGYVAKYLIGYDRQTKHLVEFDANNFGAATYSSEDGWRGDVLSMTSALATDPKAPYVANRFTYTVTSPDTFSVDWSISRTSALEWRTSDHFTCKRR
jgi:hypothetical protein